MSLYCLLTYLIYHEKSALFLIYVSLYVTCLFPLAAFTILSLVFSSLNMLSMGIFLVVVVVLFSCLVFS